MGWMSGHFECFHCLWRPIKPNRHHYKSMLLVPYVVSISNTTNVFACVSLYLDLLCHLFIWTDRRAINAPDIIRTNSSFDLALRRWRHIRVSQCHYFVIFFFYLIEACLSFDSPLQVIDTRPVLVCSVLSGHYSSLCSFQRCPHFVIQSCNTLVMW